MNTYKEHDMHSLSEMHSCYKPPKRRWWIFGPKEYCPICKKKLQILRFKQIWPSGRRYITKYECSCGYEYVIEEWKNKWEDKEEEV